MWCILTRMTITDWLGQHSITDTIVLYWIFSAIVNAMPEPAVNGNGWYKWLYTFLTTIAGHLHDAMNQRQTQQATSQAHTQKPS